MKNLDKETVDGFGDEWSRFDQSSLTQNDRVNIFNDYFDIFPWNQLPSNAVGADIGCGSGRWALLVAPRVGELHCVDPSVALEVARKNLIGLENVQFHRVSVDDLPFADGSLDFAYSLGVLHHVPDTAGAIRSIAGKLKAGSPLLMYLYYAFDNRPFWFRALWSVSDKIRAVIARMPYPMRYGASQLLAIGVYWPLARVAYVLEKIGGLPGNWPLAYYRDKSLYVMRTDALDRFGTRLEQRFTRQQIRKMLDDAGFENIRFSETQPYWCSIAYRRHGAS